MKTHGGDMRARSRETDDELRRLKADSFSQGDRIWVAHFFSHFHSPWAERFYLREALKGSGFGIGGDVDSDEEITGDGYWHHWAYTVIPASAEKCLRLDRLAEEIAREHGARYNGWMVVRDADGKPRDMTAHYRIDADESPGVATQPE